MQPSNALQQMLLSKHMAEDPGDAKHLVIDRDRFYYSLKPATTETRTLDEPHQAGLVGHIGCAVAYTVVVTVKQKNVTLGTVTTTGTITFSSTAQWIGLVSVELTPGVFAWQATDVYGCTTTIQTAQNWSAAVAAGSISSLVVATAISANSILATNVSIGTGLTAPALVGTNVTLASNITALTGVFKSLDCSTGMSALTGVFKSIDCSTGMTANALTAGSAVVSTNLTVRSLISASSMTGAAGNITALSALGLANTNLTVASGLNLRGALNIAGAVMTDGGTSATVNVTKWSTVQQLSNPINFVSATNATANYFRLPAAAIGLVCNVVNMGSAAAIIGDVSGVPLANFSGPTTHLLSLGAGGAASNAIGLVCDGTTWWHKAS